MAPVGLSQKMRDALQPVAGTAEPNEPAGSITFRILGPIEVSCEWARGHTRRPGAEGAAGVPSPERQPPAVQRHRRQGAVGRRRGRLGQAPADGRHAPAQGPQAARSLRGGVDPPKGGRRVSARRRRPTRSTPTSSRSSVRLGRGALVEGDAAGAARVLHEADALWRGPALVDVALQAFAQDEIRRLDELRLGALEARVDADLALDRHAELIGELEALVKPRTRAATASRRS